MSSGKPTRRGSARKTTDPFFDSEMGPPIDHKLAQLCSQVAAAISYTLTCECQDPLLSNLAVATVEPAPSARRMRVVVYSTVWSEDFDADAVVDRLQRATGFLRSEVAQAIHRKRTPELVFEVVHPAEVEP